MIKAVKCLPQSQSLKMHSNKMWLISSRGGSKAEEAEMWFSVRSSLLPDRTQVPSCPYLGFRIPAG